MASAAKRKEGDATRRDRILAAAQKLIAQHGFEATTTKAIAAEADVPSGLVFYYFDTKDALIEAIFDQNPRIIEDSLANAQGRSLEEVLKAIYDSILAHRYKPQILIAAVASSHPIAKKALYWRRLALAALADYFRSLSAEPTAVDPEVLASVVSASMITALVVDKPRDISSFIRGLASVVRSGLARREG